MFWFKRRDFYRKKSVGENFMLFCKVNFLLYGTMNSSLKISLCATLLIVRHVPGVDGVLALTQVVVRAKAAPWEATASGQRSTAHRGRSLLSAVSLLRLPSF